MILGKVTYTNSPITFHINIIILIKCIMHDTIVKLTVHNSFKFKNEL